MNHLQRTEAAKPSATLVGLRALVLRAAEPQLGPSERAVKARDAGAELEDVRDLARLGALLPGRISDQIRAFRGDVDAEARLKARDAIAEARAVAIAVPADYPNLIGNRGLVPGLGTLGQGLPLIRQLADPSTSTGLPVIPAMPPAALVGEIQTPGVATPASSTITIGDSATPPRWTTAVAIAEVSHQLFDFAEADANSYLDQIIDDAVDRAAEQNIAAALITAAGGTAAAGADLPSALDTAESLAGAALNAPADLVLVSPTDLPKVRRAVAASWQSDPHPTLLCSAGIPAGKVVITGRSAFVLVAQSLRGGVETTGADRDVPANVLNIQAMQIPRPRNWSVTVATWRDFILSVRLPAGVRVVTL